MKRIRYIFLTLFCCLLLSAGGVVQTFATPLSATDERIAANSLHDTLEYNRSGVVSTWSNPDSQMSGTSQSLKTFQTADGTYCREFQESVVIAGRPADAYGTACRQADGHWKIVSADRGNTAPVQRATSQAVKRTYPVTAYGPSYASTWWYPGYLVFGFSYYDDHHRSHYRSGKYRNHLDGHSHRGKGKFRGWSRKHDWFDHRGWDDHRGRGGKGWRRGHH